MKRCAVIRDKDASHIRGPNQLTARSLSIDFLKNYRMHEKYAYDYCIHIYV